MRNPHFLYIKTVHKLLCNRNIFPLSGAKIKKKVKGNNKRWAERIKEGARWVVQIGPLTSSA